MNNRVAITGANGFIGFRLYEFLQSKGYDVIRLMRNAGVADTTNAIAYDLGMKEFPLSEPVDTLIHCAWAFRKGSYRTNLRACDLILRYATQHKVRIIFISSLTASDSVLSEYGRSKYMASQLFADAGQMVIYPGLVTGPGGMFERLMRILPKLPVIPLPAGGRQILQLISISDLCSAVEKGMKEGITGSYFLAYAQPIVLSELFRRLLTYQGKKRILLPVPESLYRAAIILQHRMGITSFSIENLEALLSNVEHNTLEDLAIFGISDKQPSDAISLNES